MSKASLRDSNILDICRSLSAIGIMGVHCADAFHISQGWLQMWSGASGVGIVAFAAISGYLVWKSYDRSSSAFSFLWKRFISLYPTYILLIGLMYVYYKINHVVLPPDSSGLYWWRYVLCMNILIPTEENFWVNLCATWMIPSFFVFYALVPLLKKWIINFNRAVGLMLISIVVSNIYFSLGTWLLQGTSIDSGIISSHPIRNMMMFFIGILVYYALKEHREVDFLLICGVLGVMSNIAPQYVNYTVGISASVALLLYISDKIKLPQNRVTQAFKDLNGIGFEIYLFHSFLLNIFPGIVSALPKGPFQLLFIFFYTVYFSVVIHRIVSECIVARLSSTIKRIA